MKKSKRRKSRFEKIVTGVFSSLLVLLLVLGLAGAIVYKSGEMALKASANAQEPVMHVDTAEVSRIRENLQYNSSMEG